MGSPAAITIFDALVLLAVAIPFALLVRHRQAIPPLPDMQNTPEPAALSVVIPARDEAAAIGRAISSLLSQDYPGLEVIAVDDRSSDSTAEVLRDIARHDARLMVISVTELPAGWLGKNHALSIGAGRATGAWLLFTDADVVFAPRALVRAVAYAERERLDHLTLAPLLVARGILLRGFVAFFAYAFVALWGAYLANDPRSRRGVGIGAFNLMRRDAYLAIGGMKPLSLRPDDDIRLGRRLRAFGFRQRVLNGRDAVSVEWYASLGAALSGLEKSLYASAEYRIRDAAISIVFLVATMVWPFVGFVIGVDRVLLGPAAALLLIGLAETHRQAIGPLSTSALVTVALLPFSALCFAYALARSAVLAERRGVNWRGRVYPLTLLRSQSGLEGAPRSDRATGRRSAL
jgi:cellulose synthase/poly-beta-1,6-N-acetylglucosamine synthase-like glycosyltransferase